MVAQLQPCGAADWEVVADKLGRWSKVPRLAGFTPCLEVTTSALPLGRSGPLTGRCMLFQATPACDVDFTYGQATRWVTKYCVNFARSSQYSARHIGLCVPVVQCDVHVFWSSAFRECLVSVQGAGLSCQTFGDLKPDFISLSAGRGFSRAHVQDLDGPRLPEGHQQARLPPEPALRHPHARHGHLRSAAAARCATAWPCNARAAAENDSNQQSAGGDWRSDASGLTLKG